jgi:hypothetical protein
VARVGVKFDVAGDVQYSRAFDAAAEEAKDLSEPLRSIGDSLLRAVHEQFRTEGAFGHGSKWKPLNPQYERWKREQVGDQPMLVFRGLMRLAMIAKAAVRIEPRRLVYEPDAPDYAAFHQDGDEGRGLPQRKMVELPMTERRQWDRYFAEWLNSIRRGRLAGLAL